MKSTIFSILFIGVLAANAQNVLAKAELEAENIDEVRVDGSFVDVYVKNGSKTTFKGVITGNGDEGDYRFDTDIVGRTLVIKVVNSNSRRWGNYKIDESRIDITIPDKVKLDIDNSSGDVYVANLRASDSKIEATSGDITLKSIVANLEVETSSGDIEIDGLIGDSEIESTSGDQDLYDVKGNIRASASSGDITVSKFVGKLNIEATSGDIELRGGEGALKIRTTSGNIDGNDVLLNDNAYFDATSGNIEIDFENDLGDLSFDLTASSGDLEVGSRSSDKRLMIDRGGYKVTGVTSSGDQEYE